MIRLVFCHRKVFVNLLTNGLMGMVGKCFQEAVLTNNTDFRGVKAPSLSW
jgi:hypothetical protein